MSLPFARNPAVVATSRLLLLLWLLQQQPPSFVVTALSTSGVPVTSMRDALIAKSKELSSSTTTRTTVAPSWSNRAATCLTPVHPDGVYTADRAFYWNKIDVGCRCTVVELPSNGKNDKSKPDLWIHSPIGLDGPMAETMALLGNVKHVCTPNYEHTKFAAAWSLNYQKDGVHMWGCPGLSERMPQIPWEGEIPDGYRPRGFRGGDGTTADQSQSLPNDVWDTDILQPLHINIEHNPFTGKPFFNEVIYYHTPTKTLLTTDLFWNYPSSDGIPNGEFGRDDSWELAPKVDEIPIGSRLWKFGMDKVYYPFFNTLMVTDRDEYKAICHHILNVWDVECVIPAHGDILRGRDFIRSVLTKYFQLDENGMDTVNK